MNAKTILPALALALGLAACDEQKSTPAASSAAVTSAAPAASSAPASAAASSATPTTVAPPTAAADPAAYDIDASHSRVGFSVRHMMVSNTRGEFKKYSGTVFIDEKDLSKTAIDITVETDSIDTGDKKRDDHLKSPDFFDSKKFPKMTFKSTKAERKATGGYALTGDLTIRDKTKSITLDVDPLTPELKDPWGGTHRGTHASAKINRTDFDLKWNKALESGGVVVAEEVTLDLEIELLKKADKK